MTHISIIKLNLKLEPELAYHALSKNQYFCFLDSSLEESKYSKFSYFCAEPDFWIKSNGFINEKKYIKMGKTVIKKGCPLDFLNDSINEYIHFDFSYIKKKLSYSFFDDNDGTYIKENAANDGAYIKENISLRPDIPSFKGGFVGYFSYDLKNYIEHLPNTVKDDLNLPYFNLFFFRKIFSYSHKEKSWFFSEIIDNDNKEIYNDNDEIEKSNSKHSFPSLEEIKISSEKACLLLRKMTSKYLSDCDIVRNIINKYLEKKIDDIKIMTNILKEEYLSSVLKAKKYIHEGEIYQVNFTHRFFCEIPVQPNDFYYILRKINPAPFSAFLSFPDIKIASSSPERFIFIKGNYIETRPIKGTRPRGNSKKEDLVLKKELKSSIKDRAELNMIVDLERNDLGKFCKYGSVKVQKHAVIEKYAKVFHLVSTVTGKIKKGVTFLDILKSVFPGGSITGAPKIRAMQIIDEIEKNARSIYTGSIGYVGIDGTTDLNICIRTFLIKGKKFYYNTGGGIVEDSVPKEEYLETLQKGEALQESLRFFEYKNLIKQRGNLKEKL